MCQKRICKPAYKLVNTVVWTEKSVLDFTCADNQEVNGSVVTVRAGLI